MLSVRQLLNSHSSYHLDGGKYMGPWSCLKDKTHIYIFMYVHLYLAKSVEKILGKFPWLHTLSYPHFLLHVPMFTQHCYSYFIFMKGGSLRMKLWGWREQVRKWGGKKFWVLDDISAAGVNNPIGADLWSFCCMR